MLRNEPYFPSRFEFLHLAAVFALVGVLVGGLVPRVGQAQGPGGPASDGTARMGAVLPSGDEGLASDSATNARKLGARPRRKCAGGPGSCLDVLTYNAKFFWGSGGKNPKKRARKMIDWIARPDKQAGSKVSSLTGPVDVVVINELVLGGPESILRNKLSNSYKYNLTKREKPTNWVPWFTEGGVEIFSQHKIINESYKRFPEEALKKDPKIWNGFKYDKSVAHGVVHAEIKKSGKTYHIFATHFDTRAGKKDCKNQRKGWKNFQKKTVKELKKFVRNKAGGEPAIIAGDLNFGVGLQKCSINQRAFQWTLKHLGAVEPAHPEDTEVGKDFSANGGKLSSNSDAGRVLDHIMVRNFPLSNQSFARRLWFGSSKTSSSNIGIKKGNNLSDHHPVYAFLQTCKLPKISSLKISSTQQGGTSYPLNPTLELELSRAPSCALRVQWEIAPSSSFKKIVYSTSGKLRKKSASVKVPYGKLAPNTTYHWRSRVTLPRAKWSGSRRRWPPKDNHTSSVIWDPTNPNAPGASSKKRPFASASKKRSFMTLSFQADAYESNDKRKSAPTLKRSKWSHKHMICPIGAVVPTKTSGKCAGIFTTTKSPGPNAPLVAYEKWTMKLSNLTLEKKDVDYFKVKLPKIDFNNPYAKRKLKNNPCATLKIQAQKRKQPNRKIQSSPELITSVYPDKSSRSKGYKLNDPLGVSVKEPKIKCKKWVNKKGEQGPKYIKIGKKKGNHWGGYQLRIEISIKLAHKKYEQAVATEKAQWRDVTRMERLQMAGPLRSLLPDPEKCSGPVCRLKFPNPVGLQPGEKPFPGGPDCRQCQEGMLFRVGKVSPFEMTVQAPPALDFRLLDASGKVVAEASRMTEPRMTEVDAFPSVETTAAQASTRRSDQADLSARTDVRKRISVERLEPGQYMLLLEGSPSMWKVEARTLPSKGKPKSKGKSGDQSVQQVTEPGGLEVTALAKVGTYLPGVSTFEDISGAASSALGGQQSVFTWGGSVAFGARDGPLGLRLTGLRTTGSLISTSEGVEAAEGPVREKMTLLTGEVVLRPIPRFLVQPYVIGGAGARRLSVRRFNEISGGPRWDVAAQIGVGADVRVGPVTLGVEVVDYLTGLRSGSGLQHDAFGFLTLGIPLY